MVVSYAFYVFYFTQNEKVIAYFGLVAPPPTAEVAEAAEAKQDPEFTSALQTDGAEAKTVQPTVIGEQEQKESFQQEVEKKLEKLEQSLTVPETPPPRSTSGMISETSDVPKAGKSCESLEGNFKEPTLSRQGSKNSYTLKGLEKRRPSRSGSKVYPDPCDYGDNSASAGLINSLPPAFPPANDDQPEKLTAVKSERLQEQAAEKEKESHPLGQSENSQQTAPAESVGEQGDEEDEPGFCRYEPIMFLIDKIMPTDPEKLYWLFGLCCLWIGVFTYFAVDSSTRLGCLMELEDEVMGLIVLAAGTSVPDAMGSIAVARDGMGDMAVANAVGSNTFDILLGLGLPWFIWALVQGEPIVLPTEHTDFAILVLTCCLVGYLAILILNRWRLTKLLGVILLIIYVSVVALILLRYYGHF